MQPKTKAATMHILALCDSDQDSDQDSNQDALAFQANPINAIANPEHLTSLF